MHKMNSDVEQIVAHRNRILRKLLYGIPLSFGSLALQDTLPASWHGLHALAALPSFVGIPLFLIGSWQMRGILRRLNADKRLAHAVNDERTQANWLKAAAFALALVIGVNGLVVALGNWGVQISSTALGEGNDVIAIAASLGLFLHLDGRD